MTAWAVNGTTAVQEYFPAMSVVAAEIPARPRAYLSQARESLHAPAGAQMLAASAVDAMLKERGLTSGSLYARIGQAVTQNLLTAEMAEWAHAVRLDANDQRHADEASALPNEDDAKRSIEFASALGEILFVLPTRIQRGLHPGQGKQ